MKKALIITTLVSGTIITLGYNLNRLLNITDNLHTIIYNKNKKIKDQEDQIKTLKKSSKNNKKNN